MGITNELARIHGNLLLFNPDAKTKEAAGPHNAYANLQ
jgi:hypothetical protein